MAIGVFDSGIGGLSIHRALTAHLPQADFLYLADQKNTPYGDRPGEDIVALTQSCCETLFDAGASLVVLACNTASAAALRRLQENWLMQYRRMSRRPVNILGIIVPTIEAATGLPWAHEAERSLTPLDLTPLEKSDVVGIFATAATARSRVYEIEIDKRRPDIGVFTEACSGLADMIERAAPREDLSAVIKSHVEALKHRIGRYPDRAILGCTHYEIIADLFRDNLPDTTQLIGQPEAVARALCGYIERHPDYEIGHAGRRTFLTTGQPGPASALAASFWGAPLKFESVDAVRAA